MSNSKEIQRQASELYNLATEARTVKNTVEFIALLLFLKKKPTTFPYSWTSFWRYV